METEENPGEPIPDQIKKLFENICQSNFIGALTLNEYITSLRSCCKSNFEKVFQGDPVKLSICTKQGSEKWKFERSFRVTGNLYDNYSKHKT